MIASRRFTAAVLLSLATCVMALFSASPASASWQSPTAGVTCTVDGGNDGLGRYIYYGRCTGTPIPPSRGYRYRVVINCEGVNYYGIFQRFGDYSSKSCPYGNPTTNARVQFAWV